MGAWGPAIFSDDTACDVRDDYRELVGEGHEGPKATEILLNNWKTSLEDPDDGPVFWLALAETQWKCGRLEEKVKKRAIEIIEDGSDLRKWEDEPKSLEKRRQVLLKLREQLNSPQPPPKRLPKTFKNACEWELGEVVSYRLKSGNFVLFRVIGHHSDKGGTSPVCELLDWSGPSIPGGLKLRFLGIKKGTRQVSPPTQFLLGRTNVKELPEERVSRIGIKLKPSQEVGGFSVFLWRYLDRQLLEMFGVE
jgi:hypothetical protein